MAQFKCFAEGYLEGSCWGRAWCYFFIFITQIFTASLQPACSSTLWAKHTHAAAWIFLQKTKPSFLASISLFLPLYAPLLWCFPINFKQSWQCQLEPTFRSQTHMSRSLTWIVWYWLLGGLTVYQDRFRFSSMFFPSGAFVLLWLCVCVCVRKCVPVCLRVTSSDTSLLGCMDLVLRRSNESRWALSPCVSTHRPADHESRQVYAAVATPWGKGMQHEQPPRGTHTLFPFAQSDWCTCRQSSGQGSIKHALHHCLASKATCFRGTEQPEALVVVWEMKKAF